MVNGARVEEGVCRHYFRLDISGVKGRFINCCIESLVYSNLCPVEKYCVMQQFHLIFVYTHEFIIKLL